MTRSSRVVCVGAQQAAVCVFVALLAVRLSSLGGAEARQKSAISSEGTRLARHPGADGTPTRQSARGLWGPATYPNGTARPHGLRPWELAADVADVFGANPAKGHPSFDHQTVEYDAQFKPVNTPHDAQVTLTPFFSPDSSISTLTALIQGVKQGGQIDVGTPGISVSLRARLCRGGLVAACVSGSHVASACWIEIARALTACPSPTPDLQILLRRTDDDRVGPVALTSTAGVPGAIPAVPRARSSRSSAHC